MGVEVKTIGELIDELVTTSNKIYHLIDQAMANNDGGASLKAQEFNIRRNALIRAINDALGTDNIGAKVIAKDS